MKAYIAHDGDEQWTVIYTTNGAAARRQAAAEFDCDFAEVESCRRAPSLDQYADTSIPIQEMLDLGWHFECHGCGREFSTEIMDDGWDYRRDEPLPQLSPVGTYQGRCYCTPACRDETLESNLVAHDAGLLAIGELKLRVDHHFPGCQVTRVEAQANGHGYVRHAAVEFAFPGAQHGGGRLDWHAGLTVAAGDYDAWRHYREQAWAYPDLPRVLRMFER